MELWAFEPGKDYAENLHQLSKLPPHETAEIWLQLCKSNTEFVSDVAFHGACIERLLQGAYAADGYSDVQRQRMLDFVVEVLRVAIAEGSIGRHRFLKLIQAVGNSISFHETYHGTERLRDFARARGLIDSWGGELP
jgi:hypothetical protein